jgi:hypothetical protein
MPLETSKLIPKVASKLEFRNRALAEMGDEFVRKEARRRKLWQVRLANHMAALARFDAVKRKIREVFSLTAKSYLIMRISWGIKTRLIMADFIVTII